MAKTGHNISSRFAHYQLDTEGGVGPTGPLELNRSDDQLEKEVSKYIIAVIVGSLRADSLNRKLALAIAELAPNGFRFLYPAINDLPPYNQDEDGNQPAFVARLKSELRAAHGLMLVTP